jgi:hypothetical protein
MGKLFGLGFECDMVNLNGLVFGIQFNGGAHEKIGRIWGI